MTYLAIPEDIRNLFTRDEAADYLMDVAGWSPLRKEFTRNADIRKCLTRDQARDIIASR